MVSSGGIWPENLLIWPDSRAGRHEGEPTHGGVELWAVEQGEWQSMAMTNRAGRHGRVQGWLAGQWIWESAHLKCLAPSRTLIGMSSILPPYSQIGPRDRTSMCDLQWDWQALWGQPPSVVVLASMNQLKTPLQWVWIQSWFNHRYKDIHGGTYTFLFFPQLIHHRSLTSVKYISACG